jgi:tRNA nucleotidyltransferase (CCA-adding enzyme)
MERSPNPGSTSSTHLLSRASVEEALRTLASREPLRTLVEALSPAQLYLVGGTVRDAFLDRHETDLDVATNLDAETIRQRCVARGIRTIDTGIQHGTVLAVVHEQHIEVTTFRHPSTREQQHSAHDIQTDLSGRDFTINSIAFDLAAGTIIDPSDGAGDISRGLVRAVGDAAGRLSEDPLRILRMIRFGAAQGRQVDPTTFAAAQSLVQRLGAVSVERIKSELDEILMSPLPHLGVRALLDVGALPYTIPELLPAVGFEQNRFHIHDVFEHTLWVLERTPQDRLLRWAAVFHDIGKPHTLSVDGIGNRHFYQHEVVSEKQSRTRMHALRFSRDDTDKICSIVRHHMRPLDCGAAGVRRLIRDLGDDLPRWRAFKAADSPPTMPDQEFKEIAEGFDILLAIENARRTLPSYGKLAVSGSDIIALGASPGPTIGRILKELEELVIEDPSRNEREVLLEEARRRLTTEQ